jgi:signal peptidase
MTSARMSPKVLGLAVAGLLLAVLSVPLWAGSLSYVVPRGASMAPRLSDGDLAVVRSVDSYRVGDIAAYRNTALHRVVVHRIVAIDNGVYTFKGDANAFPDPQQVRRTQLVGRLSTSVPWVGSALLWLASPVNALLLLALIVLLVRSRSGAVPRRAPADGAATPSLDLDDDRIIPIADMSFPHELAVADVTRPESLLKLAARYDRPVLHDEAQGVLFVVESSMLFRCQLAVPAAAELTVVRDLEPVAAGPRATRTVVPAAVPAAAPQDRPRRHAWPQRTRPKHGRRPSPYGRDWGYGS